MCRHSFSYRLQCGLLLVITGLMASSVWADDINPPPYWGESGSVMAFWEDQGSGLILENWRYKPSLYPLWREGDDSPSLNIQAAPGGGTLYDFWMPNFIDPDNFIKEMRIQVSFFDHTDTGEAPLIWNVWGANNGAPVMGSLSNHVMDASTTPGALYFFEDWVMHPNPDWEFINIFTPNGVILHEVVIDTVSYVPLPPAAILFSFALIMLAAIGHHTNNRAQKPTAA